MYGNGSYRYSNAQKKLEVRWVPDKGRGVFAMEDIAKGEVVEIAHVILLSDTEYQEHSRHTELFNYLYEWVPRGWALALGVGSLFNHSSSPNMGYLRSAAEELIRYATIRDVKAGEELCISYGENLWFSPAVEGDAGKERDGDEKSKEAGDGSDDKAGSGDEEEGEDGGNGHEEATCE